MPILSNFNFLNVSVYIDYVENMFYETYIIPGINLNVLHNSLQLCKSDVIIILILKAKKLPVKTSK